MRHPKPKYRKAKPRRRKPCPGCRALEALARDADQLLRAVRVSVIQIYQPTGEFRFQGLMYSSTDGDWSTLCDVMGRERIERAIAACSPANWSKPR